MSNAFLLYKFHEPALVKAFEQSKFLPEVHPITHSDMIATGGTMHSSRVKVSFTARSGPFVRAYIYIPGSLIAEQAHLTDDEKAAVEQWLHVIEASLKQGTNHKV
jgi:hypothetical protein